MTTEPPAGGGWQPPASYPPPQPQQGGQPSPGGQPEQGGQPPAGYPPPQPPAAYPPPQPPAGYLPEQAPQGQGGPFASAPPSGAQPSGTGLPGMPPGSPYTAGQQFDAPLPEPPPGMQPALQWGDPTPAPAPPPRPGPPPPYSRLAITALVLGLLGSVAGLSLIVGAVALFRIRKTHRRGTALAVIGMVLAPLWLGAGFALYAAVLSKPPVRDAAGIVVRKGEVPVNQLRIGDCVEKWATAAKIDQMTVVPCTTAHDAEIFHTFDIAGEAYPGDPAVTKEATTQCLEKSKTGIKEADLKNAKVALLKPLEPSWGKGDHQVTCVAVQNSGTITRSIRK